MLSVSLAKTFACLVFDRVLPFHYCIILLMCLFARANVPQGYACMCWGRIYFICFDLGERIVFFAAFILVVIYLFLEEVN